MKAHGINWGALLWPAWLTLCALLIAAAWLAGKIRRLSRRRIS